MPRIRVLVVEDSLTVRKRIIETLSTDPALEVVGEAADGKTAIELCHKLSPNVITLDMMMPVMTGLDATEHIMAHHPTPILIVSSSTNRGDLFRTYDALAAGAVDVLEKPRADEEDGRWEQKLIATVKLVSRIKVITHPRGLLQRSSLGRGAEAWQKPSARSCQLVAIGASTGGPAALVEILRTLPANFGLPVLLVLHIDEPFARYFADWLNDHTSNPVAYAEDHAPLAEARGRVLMAPPDHHLVVEGDRLRLTRTPARHACRPSVDELFESIAREHGPRSAACLLTGMGKDGAAGLLAIRLAGGITIAQDEATSVVYGMPREAALLGAAGRILSLGEIGPALMELDPARTHPGEE